MNDSTATLPVAGYPTHQSLIDLFAEQVSQTPDGVAVVFGEQQLTYRQLDRQSNQLAHYLQKQGVTSETLVPICVDRSADMIVGLLGILKAGGAYVPIDSDYPATRIDYILTDVGAAVVVCDAASRPALEQSMSGCQVVCLNHDKVHIRAESDQNVPTRPLPAHLAYVIYTSGSTGQPKGVLLEHRNVVSLLKPTDALFDFDEQDVWTMFHSFCFDFSVWEMYGALLYGGRLVVVPKAVATDSARFVELLCQEGVTVLNQTPAAFYVMQEAVGTNGLLPPVRYVIFGGEALNPTRIRAWHSLLPSCKLINMYGITETTVHVTYQALEARHLESVNSPIGRAIPTLRTYVLSETLQPVAPGETGELYVGGAGVARGYLNRPELTAERFIPNPFEPLSGERLYRSGDLARFVAEGEMDYIGRIDHQVKIRGYRIELGEIEQALLLEPAVRQAVVLAKPYAEGDVRLVGFVVTDATADPEAILATLRTQLPAYMLPHRIVVIDSIPLTSNGKVDRTILLGTDGLAPQRADGYVAPGNPTETMLRTHWQDILTLPEIGVTDNFFEIGGNSLLAMQAAARAGQSLGRAVAVTKLYQHPTIRTLARYLDGNHQEAPVAESLPKPTATGGGDIAIIGMAGRFPGAETVDALWDVLRMGQETIHFFDEQELDASLPARLTRNPDYVKARGIVPQAEYFDAAFFGLSSRLAEVMDPQHRIFMEIAWEVLEQTGYLPHEHGSGIGVWAGCGNNTYYLNNILPNEPVLEQVGEFQAMTVNEKDFIASRTAYQLNLGGPAVSVYSACSTSLLAVTQAVDALRLGQCALALAGGASITAPIRSGHRYEAGAMLSRDGHCRPFDAAATGTVFSDGAGVVLLKRREEAERDGDTIYALIRGVGVNNDGSAKGSFTAPNATGQAGAIRKAMADAHVPAATLSYIEAHGTATPLGDPIELEGLTLAFGDVPQRQFCALGSIKSNLGHLTAAAGVAGLIKTALALHHRELPASIGYQTPNPVIDFAGSPFYVNAAHTPWVAEGPRRAGVSSFGVGGTNVHVVVEEHNPRTPAERTLALMPARPVQLVAWSAKSTASLHHYAGLLAETMEQRPTLPLPDVAATLLRRPTAFAHRQFLLAETQEALSQQLTDLVTLGAEAQPAPAPDEVIFLFPGQGTQYIQMGQSLYEHEPTYRQAVDTCAEHLLPHLQTDIREVLFPDVADQAAKQRLSDTRYTQPALFVTEYALARLWQSWGIEPTVFCGHSVGEFVAAHLAGVWSLPDVLGLIAARGQLIGSLPTGAMLSVRLPAETVEALLPPTLSLAAINSRQLCVVAGPHEAIAALATYLTEQGTANRLLDTSHAFHSAMLDPIVADFEQLVATISLQRPRKPIVSTVSGTWLTDAEAISPAYWAGHMRATVRFTDALATVSTVANPLLLEVGPGTVTATLARQAVQPRSIPVLASLDTAKGERTEYAALLTALGQLWRNGLLPDWSAFQAGRPAHSVSLPTYAFDRKRCWIDPVIASKPALPTLETTVSPIAGEPITNTMMTRQTHLIALVGTMLHETAGLDTALMQPTVSFLELGLDSLTLTQFSYLLRKKFDLPISFRQLNHEFSTLAALTEYMDQHLPADAFQPPQPVADPVPQPAAAPPMPPLGTYPAQPVPMPAAPIHANPGPAAHVPGATGPVMELLERQLAVMAQQLTVLSGYAPAPAPVDGPVLSAPSTAPMPTAPPRPADPQEPAKPEPKAAFGAGARIDRQATTLNSVQAAFLQQLIDRYTQKTAQSKQYAQQHRRHMADPRAVTGFRPLTKELVYPLVVDRSGGSRLIDLDGNEYIDALNGFGSSLFGYQPAWLKNALLEQIDRGYELGPQHKLAGEVCQLLCAFTGFDRAALCNTGSEAVLAALRMARTVTGRTLVVTFTGSYHGVFDEVISRGMPNQQSTPAALGIPTEAVQNLLILDYGTEESLAIIRQRAHEIAAVLVEPVQSRRPEFQPIDFLKQVRVLTESSGAALIFDEVITGFRMHSGGAQALFGIRADLATYGKVIGGGLPIGVVAGTASFMDTLDGGYWQYGDDSFPQADLTFFAGTFVRHPLALATAKAVLTYLREQGPTLQEALTTKARRLADALNVAFAHQQIPLLAAQFGSLWKLKWTADVPYGELLFTLLRDKGIHIWDGFPCFMTEAHTEADLRQMEQAILDSVGELVAAQFVPATAPAPSRPAVSARYVNDISNPPVPNARLGRDKQGNPAWFVSDPDRPGKYLQLA